MNGFHDPSELRRQIEAASTAMESIRGVQKALVHPPALEGLRRTVEEYRRMQKALVHPPALEGLRRTVEEYRRMQKALVHPPALEGLRRTVEEYRRMQKALVHPPALEGLRRTVEEYRRMQKALVHPPALEGLRRTVEEYRRMQKALVHPPALEGLRRTVEEYRRMQKALVRPPALEGLRRAVEEYRRMQKALVHPPALEGLRRVVEAWNASSLALHRTIQAIRVDALDVRVGYGDRLVADAEEARGRDQRGRRLRKAGQTATNWLGRLASRRKVRPPVGSSLRGFAEFVFSKKSNEQIYDPLLSDLHIEYCEALDENRRGKARWVRVRGYGSFLAALLVHGASSGGRVWRIFQSNRD